MRKLILCLLTCLLLTTCTVGIARRDEFLPEATGTPRPTPLPTATETAPPTATDTPLPSVTDTLLSPSPTSTPTSTSTPTPTSIPTPTPTFPPTSHPPTSNPTTTPFSTEPPTPCAIGTGPAFQPRLDDRAELASALGCPIEEQQQTWAAEQPFQHGRMFWRADTDRVYILFNDDRTFQIESDPYVEGDPVDACPEVGNAPEGLYKPVRGFNRQWCNVSGVREKLGWALEEEMGYEAAWQGFERGHVLLSRANHIFVLHDEGTWEYVE